MWVPLPALLCEFTGFYELYANHSARAGLIHHLGSRGWMDGWLSSSPHTPQPPAICRNWLLARAGPAGKRGGGQWDAHSSPSSWKWFSSLHTTFPQHKKIPPKSGVRMGCWELQKTAAVSENHQELALLITGFGELPRTLQ